jgi:1,2-diacylglycerol 3-beta-galactosyltransferase
MVLSLARTLPDSNFAFVGAAHSTWFDKRADYIFVPSEEVRRIALSCGIKRDKIVVHGLPIRPAFWSETKPKRTLRSRLGLCQDCKTVLVMGGGDGVGNLCEVATEIGETLGKRNGKSEVVVVCGHNSNVANKLQAKSWPSNVDVKVKGFVNNIDEYMGASDCIVTKAGPGTIAEAMVRKLPVIISSFLPGQVFIVRKLNQSKVIFYFLVCLGGG